MAKPPSGQVIVGDCLDVIRGWQNGCLDLVIADPPYSINSKSDGAGKLSPWADMVNNAYWHAAWIGECRRLLQPKGCLWAFLNWRSLVSYQKAACDLGWPIESILIWDKSWIGPGGTKGLRPSYEMVALWAMPEFSIDDRGLADIQRFNWSAHKPSGHPAEKPVALMRWLIEASLNDEPGAILDPFCGSGTTLEAAERMGIGHAWTGIELDETWAAFARRRAGQQGLNFTEAA